MAAFYDVPEGPLGPMAKALNELANKMDVRRATAPDEFGLRALFEQAANIMVTCDAQERIRNINDTVPGLTVEAVRGKPIYDMIMPHGVDRVRALFRRVLTTGQPEEYETQTTADIGGGAAVTVGPLPTLKAGSTQLRQLLQNLLSNALKFGQEGTAPRFSVSSTVDPAARRCEIKVGDNGIGFDEKYLDRLFNLFQRLHGQSKYAGTGIGLAICRKIVERHGGTLTARSAPGQGATFLDSLPLEQTISPQAGCLRTLSSPCPGF